MDEKSITEYFRGIMEDIVNEVSLMSKFLQKDMFLMNRNLKLLVVVQLN